MFDIDLFQYGDKSHSEQEQHWDILGLFLYSSKFDKYHICPCYVQLSCSKVMLTVRAMSDANTCKSSSSKVQYDKAARTVQQQIV